MSSKQRVLPWRLTGPFLLAGVGLVITAGMLRLFGNRPPFSHISIGCLALGNTAIVVYFLLTMVGKDDTRRIAPAIAALGIGGCIALQVLVWATVVSVSSALFRFGILLLVIGAFLAFIWQLVNDPPRASSSGLTNHP
jgi:hypothetical protein